MIEAAFFDIDGTLLSFKTHAVPQSALRAIDALRAAGVACVLATGRPAYQVPACMRAIPFDACITLNGQLCLTGPLPAEGEGPDESRVIRSHPIAEEDVRFIAGRVEAGDFEVLVLQMDRAFTTAHSERVRAIERQAGLTYEDGPLEEAFAAPVFQFCAFCSPDEDEGIIRGSAHLATTRWTDLFCDVVPDDGGKRHGVAAVCANLGIDPGCAVAFGDGGNDLGMLQAVGTGVAMGNSVAELKSAADYVTTSVDDDGIWNACRHLGVI